MRIKSKIKSENGEKERNSKLDSKKSFDLRDKLITKVKSAQEQELERQKNRLKKYKANTVLGSMLDKKERSPSMNLISSDESMLSDSSSDSSTGRKQKKVETEEQKPEKGK